MTERKEKCQKITVVWKKHMLLCIIKIDTNTLLKIGNKIGKNPIL